MAMLASFPDLLQSKVTQIPFLQEKIVGAFGKERFKIAG